MKSLITFSLILFIVATLPSQKKCLLDLVAEKEEIRLENLRSTYADSIQLSSKDARELSNNIAQDRYSNRGLALIQDNEYPYLLYKMDLQQIEPFRSMSEINLEGYTSQFWTMLPDFIIRSYTEKANELLKKSDSIQQLTIDPALIHQ